MRHIISLTTKPAHPTDAHPHIIRRLSILQAELAMALAEGLAEAELLTQNLANQQPIYKHAVKALAREEICTVAEAALVVQDLSRPLI